MISWHELPAAMLIMTTLSCPLLRKCVISWHELPAAMLIMTTLACPLLRECVISLHGLPAAMLIMIHDNFTMAPSQWVRDLVAWASCCNPDHDDFAMSPLRLCVILWHELPAAMLIMMTLPFPLLRKCVILWHELPAATLITTTLP